MVVHLWKYLGLRDVDTSDASRAPLAAVISFPCPTMRASHPNNFFFEKKHSYMLNNCYPTYSMNKRTNQGFEGLLRLEPLQ